MIPGSTQRPMQPGDWGTATSSNELDLLVNTIDQDTQNALDTATSLCPALHTSHTSHPLHLVAPLSPEPSASEDLGSEYEERDGSPGVILEGSAVVGNIGMRPNFK